MKFPILTALRGNNAELFADIMQIYVPPNSFCLDMTYGLGNFWPKIPDFQYRGVTLDIATSADIRADFRHCPFPDSRFDCCILDPPYAKHGTSMKESISSAYQNNLDISPKSAREVLQLYKDGITEAHRLLVPGGVLILKCQDQIESGKQQWIHIQLLEIEGFIAEDLFVLVQEAVPAMREQYQKHARKNHSYFIVQRKI